MRKGGGQGRSSGRRGESGVGLGERKRAAAGLTAETAGEQLVPSARLVEVCLRFGVPMSVPGRTITSGLKLGLDPGTITLITGPSGSGKSLLLNEIARQHPTSRLVNNVQFPLDVAVLDAVAPTRPVGEALSLLTACGLGEPMLWIRRFNQLSDGERYRARFARAVSLQRRSGGVGPLLCDEFGAILHRRLAKAIAFNLRKLVRRVGLSVVVATSQDDLERDLRPDRVVRLGGAVPVVEDGHTGGAKPQAAGPRRRGASPAISFARELRIERGTLRDYRLFSGMHYRQREQVGFVDKVFVMRHGLGGEPLGVVVYGHPMLELKLRNRVTCGRFVRQAKRLNRELRVLKRLVVHPDVRGCGLGHWLVRRTLPLVEKPFVECLAAMGVINPVFEKAGMRPIGVCQPPASLHRAVTALRAAGADPLAADFVSQVCRRPSLRRLVARTVQDWYRATTSEHVERTARQSPTVLAQTFRQLAGSQPVYFIWTRDDKGAELIERGMRNDE